MTGAARSTLAPGARAPLYSARLTQREQRELLQRLHRREDELTAKIAEERTRIDAEGLAQLEDAVGDEVDQAFVKTSVEMERGLIDRYSGELQEIVAARERGASGLLGICIDCGEPIDRARLLARPAASRCTDCQWRYEKATDIARRSGAL